MLDGSNATPVIRDWPMVADAAGYVAGDVLVIDSNGRADKIAASVSEVLGICQETKTSAVSNDDLLKIAIATRNQVWRCSMDATSTNAKKGYDKKIDLADENTIDADDLTNGSMILVDTDTDDDGNVLAYVVFADTTFGNT
jgi:hypothetical protein